MGLTLHPKGPASLDSNKPAASPNLFVQSIALSDQQTVWVSLPQPDKIAFVINLQPKHFSLAKGAELPHHAVQFAEDLAGAGDQSGYFNPYGAQVAKVTLSLGKRGAAALVTVRKRKVEGTLAFALRVECNPRKVGSSGFEQLVAVLAQSGPTPTNVKAMLADALVRRLDVAVDVLGAAPADLLVRTKKPSKTVTYRGADGHLETLQLHQDKKPKPTVKSAKSLGKLEVKAYDRNRLKAAQSKPAPYPGFRTTRIEVVKTRFHGNVGLADLPKLKDQFAHIGVVGRDSANPWDDLNRWHSYLACRTELGEERAWEILGMSKEEIVQATKASISGGLRVLTEATWAGWPAGLERSGLNTLLGLAYKSWAL